MPTTQSRTVRRDTRQTGQRFGLTQADSAAVGPKASRRGLSKRAVRGNHRPWVAQIDRLQQGFALTQMQLATELLHCSPRSVILWKKSQAPNRAILIRLNELNRLYGALARLMPAEDVVPWMNQTNEYLDPLTPLEVLNRGQIDRLWHIIHNVGTGMPT